MTKNTKTYACDSCKKTIVFDYYNESDANQVSMVAKELSSWSTLRVSAHRIGKDKDGVIIPETVGHACCEECVKPAITNIVKQKLPD